MTTFLFANNARTTLAAPINSVATIITLATGTGGLFPSPGAGEQFALTLNDAATRQIYEIVYVTARSGDTLTVVRGREGTTATSWLAGDFARNFLTAGTAQAFAQYVVLAGMSDYWPDTGAADALVITPDPAIAGYFDGLTFLIKIAATNTGASSINVNSLGSRDVLDQNGDALTAGALTGDTVVPLVYVDGAFRMVTALPAQGFISSLPTVSPLLQSDEIALSRDGVPRRGSFSQVQSLIAEEQFLDSYFLGMM
jgi:hypothetical protein